MKLVARGLDEAAARLEQAGSSSARLDAQVLLAHVLGVARSWLFAHPETPLDAAQLQRFDGLVARRVASEPVAYLTGHKEFYGLELLVDCRVLIPRPETELLVEAVLAQIAARPGRQVCVADIGTGSGAIALAVAVNAPKAMIYAVDVSDAALGVAGHNVARLDARGQVTLLQGDLLEPLPAPVDIIAANLPYIAEAAYAELMADVHDYEPRLALEAGLDGLDAIRRLLAQAPAYLAPGGVIFLEIGHDQGAAVLELAAQHFPAARAITLHQDYAGRDRLVVIAL